jgi:hypothetical protein
MPFPEYEYESPDNRVLSIEFILSLITIKTSTTGSGRGTEENRWRGRGGVLHQHPKDITNQWNPIDKLNMNFSSIRSFRIDCNIKEYPPSQSELD